MEGGSKLLAQLVEGTWAMCLKVRDSRHLLMKGIVLTVSPSSLRLKAPQPLFDISRSTSCGIISNPFQALSCFPFMYAEKLL